MEPIDKSNPIPYYLQLAELLRRDIAQREPHHEVYQLPSENELDQIHQAAQVFQWSKRPPPQVISTTMPAGIGCPPADAT